MNYSRNAIFDQASYLKLAPLPSQLPAAFVQDFRYATNFLLSYQHNTSTFNSFRRDVERFVQWAWFIKKKSILLMRRDDIEEYMLFCQKPPSSWIGLKNVARFINKDGLRHPNPKWRPFVITIPKFVKENTHKHYQLSEKGFREIFTILNCFYNFMIQSEWTSVNPIVHIKQKNRFYRKQQGKAKVRRISELQWQTVMETAENIAKETPEKHERTLFIMAILYSMYLRISELAASERWIPKMNDFTQDHEGNWWFTTVGKGNKERRIAVSDTMLMALKRWRNHLKLSPELPSLNDNSPLLPRQIGNGAISDVRHIRRLVQACFDKAAQTLRDEGFNNEADNLLQATVHWIRHTGISDDVKYRPREHVRDDAGHSSSSITDRYIDIDLRERHASARKKRIK